VASAKATVQSFEQAEQFLAGGRNKTSRPLANNTYVERRTEDRIAIRLHATDVVEFTRSGLVFLNTGGWRTVTTKDRINMALPWPVGIFSVKGVWRVKTTPGWEGEWSVPFADGMVLRRINDKFEPVAGTFPSATEEEKIATARKALEKAIKGYLKHLDAKVAAWKVELQTNGSLSPAGDPWCCTMGIGQGSNDHLWQHLREGYVFLTIIRKALEDSGKYRDPVQRLLMDIQFGDASLVKKDVRKFLLKHLDPALAIRSETEQAQRYVTYAEEALQRPEEFGYFGNDESLWVTSAPTFGCNRDSENVEVANFEIVWENLVEKFPDLVKTDQDRKDENPGGIYVFGASHWACGWVDQIVVPVLKHPGTITADNIHPAFIEVCEAVEATRMYPALPGAEERAAKMETEQIVKDIAQWQDYLAQRGDPWIKAFPAELLEGYTYDTYAGERTYDWSSDGVRQAHLLACYDDSLVQVEGQGVLL
jgi:hypothetical protein